GNPVVLEQIMSAKLADYIAMDVKGPLSRYTKYCGATVDPAAIARSIALLIKGNLDYEFRTTVVPALHAAVDWPALGQALTGGRQLYLQAFRAMTPVLRPQLATLG